MKTTIKMTKERKTARKMNKGEKFAKRFQWEGEFRRKREGTAQYSLGCI